MDISSTCYPCPVILLMSMKNLRPIYFLVAIFFLVLTACHSLKPDGITKAIISGDVFSSTAIKDLGPIDYTTNQTREYKPQVRWKMEF